MGALGDRDGVASAARRRPAPHTSARGDPRRPRRRRRRPAAAGAAGARPPARARAWASAPPSGRWRCWWRRGAVNAIARPGGEVVYRLCGRGHHHHLGLHVVRLGGRARPTATSARWAADAGRAPGLPGGGPRRDRCTVVCGGCRDVAGTTPAALSERRRPPRPEEGQRHDERDEGDPGRPGQRLAAARLRAPRGDEFPQRGWDREGRQHGGSVTHTPDAPLVPRERRRSVMVVMTVDRARQFPGVSRASSRRGPVDRFVLEGAGDGNGASVPRGGGPAGRRRRSCAAAKVRPAATHIAPLDAGHEGLERAVLRPSGRRAGR